MYPRNLGDLGDDRAAQIADLKAQIAELYNAAKDAGGAVHSESIQAQINELQAQIDTLNDQARGEQVAAGGTAQQRANIQGTDAEVYYLASALGIEPGYITAGLIPSLWQLINANDPNAHVKAVALLNQTWQGPAGISFTAGGGVTQLPAPPVITAPAGPPDGWKRGALNGVLGYWAPDGLFYAGDTPWTNYHPGTGTSISTASTGGSGGGGSPNGIPSSGGPPAQDSGPGGPPGIDNAPWDGTPPAFPPEGIIPSEGGPPASDGPAQAGIFGGGLTAALIGGGLLVAYLVSRKK